MEHCLKVFVVSGRLRMENGAVIGEYCAFLLFLAGHFLPRNADVALVKSLVLMTQMYLTASCYKPAIATSTKLLVIHEHITQ